MIKINHKQSITGGIIAFLIATSCCWIPALVIGIGGATGLLGLSETLEKYSLLFFLLSLAFLGFGIYQLMKNKSKMKNKEAILLSTVTCPSCGFQKEELMPEDACQFFYECTKCEQILKPKKGDCCVFCSYGTVACPPIQLNQDCCN